MSGLPKALGEAIEGFREYALVEGWSTVVGAHNCCGEAADIFSRHCRDHGVRANRRDGTAAQFLSSFEGFTDPSVDEPHLAKNGAGQLIGTGHAVAIAECEGKRYMVDWTAPQYDVTDPWPAVKVY